MSFWRESLEGLWIFQQPTHADERGFFGQAFQRL
jgi:dTDP-4-dehydrorhamnose 3,5-epimerase-like enzyme